jgi:ABC-type Fe3+-hydroxamate transport system substrate-binding protein
MRVVSLVPSLTDTVARLGAGSSLVGVTDWCVAGAPATAVRVGGTKNPRLDLVAELRPDVVLANPEENRADDLATLRDRGLDVLVTFPRRAADVPSMIDDVAAAVRADPATASRLVAGVESALGDVQQNRPEASVPAVTLIWRKPWMAVGPDTYVDDLLAICGFTNVLADAGQRYPRIGPEDLRDRGARVVLLPSEPYAFTAEDLPAVTDLVAAEPRFVDGRLLTWHGPRTAAALRSFSALARELAGYS